MGNLKISGLMALILIFGSCSGDRPMEIEADKLLVRMALVEVVPEHLGEYLALLKEEAAASIELEPGVICIFPMQDSKDSTKIQLVEIYADHQAYEAH